MVPLTASDFESPIGYVGLESGVAGLPLVTYAPRTPARTEDSFPASFPFSRSQPWPWALPSTSRAGRLTSGLPLASTLVMGMWGPGVNQGLPPSQYPSQNRVPHLCWFWDVNFLVHVSTA